MNVLNLNPAALMRAWDASAFALVGSVRKMTSHLECLSGFAPQLSTVTAAAPPIGARHIALVTMKAPGTSRLDILDIPYPLTIPLRALENLCASSRRCQWPGWPENRAARTRPPRGC